MLSLQATQLLQARKNEEDVAGICEMCDKLRVSQIIKAHSCCGIHALAQCKDDGRKLALTVMQRRVQHFAVELN